MNWHTDMNAAPRGKTIQSQRLVTDKNSATGKSLKTVDEYQRDDVILASKCGKVIKSYWIPDENRFAGFQPGEEIDAWFPWPEHPFANTRRQQGTDGGEIAAVKGKARLANADGVEPSPSDHLYLEDVGSGA